jgi:arsenite methyltransferase
LNQVNSNNRIGIWPGILAGLSILSCYGTLVLVAILGLIGIQIEIHEGIWASVIVLLAWTAVIAVVLEFRRLRVKGPLVAAISGALLITLVMFVSYNRIVEISGFALILVAVIWNRHHASQQI